MVSVAFYGIIDYQQYVCSRDTQNKIYININPVPKH